MPTVLSEPKQQTKPISTTKNTKDTKTATAYAGETPALPVRSPLLEELRLFVRASRAPKWRTMRQFAEEEIILPSGPFKGRHFRVKYQPYSGLWFDAVDSGKWHKFAVTGPSQSGKTLCASIIPLAYFLFEVVETVLFGIPDMEMAADKWQQDILPALEQTRYSKLLPLRGPGSRAGGKMQSVSFRNGTTLRFMSGGGGDKSRAGYTARIILLTEANAFGKASKTSQEGDQASQLFARAQSFGSNGPKPFELAECTQETEESLIHTRYSAGTASRIVCPCVHCGVYVSPEREHFSGWQECQDILEAREKARFYCPECGLEIDETARRWMVERSKLVHKGQRVDPDGTIVGDDPRTDTLGFRWSGFHNLFLSCADLGEKEWSASQEEEEEKAEKKMCQFVWANPYVSPVLEEVELSSSSLVARQSSYPNRLVPDDVSILTVGVDLHKFFGCLGVVGFGEKRLFCIDYSTFDVPSKDMAEEKALLTALLEIEEVMNAGWPKESGGVAFPNLVGIDSGYNPAVVYKFCREANARLGSRRYFPSKGYGSGQAVGMERSYHAPKKSKDVVQIGQGYHFTRKDVEGVYLAHVNADEWKTWLHKRLACPKEEAGALVLYKAPQREHLTLAKHLTAESASQEFIQGKGSIRTWVRKRQANHYLDCLYGCCWLGHFCGYRLAESREAARPTVRVESGLRASPLARRGLSYR
jgi:phage terminase large subunit GpA-like protein